MESGDPVNQESQNLFSVSEFLLQEDQLRFQKLRQSLSARNRNRPESAQIFEQQNRYGD